MARGSLVFGPVCLVVCSVAAAQTPATQSDIGTAISVDPVSEQVFELGLQEGQGVIIDVTAIAASADQPALAAASAAIVGMRIEDQAGTCLRAVPAQDGCPAASLGTELEAAAGLGTVRAALRAPSSGRYRLTLALPPEAPVAGYELLVRERPVPAPARPLAISLCDDPAPEVGEDVTDPCAQPYDMGESGRGLFTFSAAAPGQWVQLDMRSADFDPVLELLGPIRPGEPAEVAPAIDMNDDSDGTHDSQLRRELPEAGQYAVIARTYAGGSGRYTLAARGLEAPAPRPVRPLTPGEPLADAFGATELAPDHLFTLAAQGGQTIVVDVTSPIDTMLEAGVAVNVLNLADPVRQEFAVLASNDDTCGLNPQLRLRFQEAQTLTLRVAPLGGTGVTGPYTLSARLGEDATCAEQPVEELLVDPAVE